LDIARGRPAIVSMRMNQAAKPLATIIENQGQEVSMNRSRQLWPPAAALIMAAVLLGLWGCTSKGSTGPGFTAIDRAVADIGLTRLGSIQADRTSGSEQPLGQPPSRQITMLIPAGADVATARMTSALTGAHFIKTGASGWQRQDGDVTVTVFVDITASGAPASVTPSSSSGTTVILNFSAAP
jgi:hypothetical protein